MQTHKLKTKIKDDLFNIDTIAHYFLCIKISTNYIEVVVFDTKIDRCVAYEYHELFTEDTTTLSATVANFVKTHAFLSIANWKAIYFMDCSLSYSFVPEEYHHENYTASYLRLTAEIDRQPLDMQHIQNLGQNCFCHFATPKSITEWSKKAYRDREVIWVHQAAAFVEGLSKSPDKLDTNNLHILCDKNSICVAHFRNGKLNFANSFATKTDNDTIYFILLAMKDLGLDAKDTKVWLYGDVEQNKGLLALLPDYLQQVKTSPRPKNQNFGYRFDDMQTWQGFDLFSAYYFTK
jgi:hypothetical protein